GVDVDEVRLGVVADAALLHGERAVAHRGQGAARQADVDPLADHVQALGRHARAFAVQHGVGLGRAVDADDVVRATAVQPAIQLRQQVEEVRIDGMDLARAEVALYAIHFAGSVGDAGAVLTVVHVTSLIGVP